MEKETVMKALSACGQGSGVCPECPYRNTDTCVRDMCGDALALLKAEEKTNEKPTYDMTIIFTKRDNLLKWFDANDTFYAQGTDAYQRKRAACAKEREIHLILLIRYEEDKCICRIKCPINPLPIKGEFEAPTIGAVSHTLKTMGWTYKDKLPFGLPRVNKENAIK